MSMLIAAIMRRWELLLVTVLVMLSSVGYQGTLNKWWYEDDPLQFHYVAQIAEPHRFFLDPQVLREFATGRTLVPMQLLSYWLDIRIAGYSPFAAYIHSLLALIATACLLCLVLVRYTHNRLLSVAVTLVWILLPSTLVVNQFLATRHYMEGLLFGLLALLLLSRSDVDCLSVGSLVAVVLAASLAMLYKEVYVPVMPTVLFLFGVYRRDYRLVAASLTLAALYLVYRMWMTGGGMTYVMPLLSAGEYMRHLPVYGYTFSANYGGYVVIAGVMILAWFAWWRPVPRSRQALVLLVFAVLTTLVGLYPVAYAIREAYHVPGTWYRVPFLVNTLIVLGGGVLLAWYAAPRWQAVVLALVLVIILPGAHRTRQLWNANMEAERQEAKFYLDNPDKLLFTQDPAIWYLIGVHRMYASGEMHFINAAQSTGEQPQSLLSEFPTVWRYRDGTFVQDDELYLDLRALNGLAPEEPSGE